MQILRIGKLPSEDTFDGECIHCKTIVRFKRSEATPEPCPDPRDHGYIGVECPVCNHRIDVALSKKNEKILVNPEDYLGRGKR